MDRNTLTGLILIFAIFLGFSLINGASRNKSYQREIHVADSLYEAGDYENARTQYLKALQFKQGSPEAISRVNEINQILLPEEAIDTTTSDTGNEAAPVQPESVVTQEKTVAVSEAYGPFSTAAQGEQSFITLSNNKIELTLAARGGRIYSAMLRDYYTYDARPVILFDGDSTIFGFNFFTSDNRPVKTSDLYFEPYETPQFIDATEDAGVAVFRLHAENGGYLQYTYTLEPDEYMVGFDVKFVDLEGKIASNLSNITFDWQAYLPMQEKGRMNEDNYAQLKYKHFQDEVDGFRERAKKEFESAEIPTRIRWVAFKDQFFSTVLIADESFSNANVSQTMIEEPSKYLKLYSAELGVPFEPQKDNEIVFKLYIGPNSFKTLKEHGYELEELVFLGRNIIKWINQYVIISIFNWLNKFIGNYGIIILILTLIIKIVLFPLTFKSFQSQAKMKVLKPLVDEINKKFPKKEDALKKQQATMDLYKKAGVSPLGGCLPMALQMPILFAMFRFFPTSIELRQEAFLWAKDLSTYDSVLNLPFNIPMYGDHVSLFTLLMTISTILTMRLNSPSQTGQEQMPGMKMMTYMMPIMFMLILNNFSSGLTYYYFLANIITFGQNMLSKRFINEGDVIRKLEESKKKPPQKSNFQKRLEEAAKQRGIRPKK